MNTPETIRLRTTEEFKKLILGEEVDFFVCRRDSFWPMVEVFSDLKDFISKIKTEIVDDEVENHRDFLCRCINTFVYNETTGADFNYDLHTIKMTKDQYKDYILVMRSLGNVNLSLKTIDL